MRYINIIFIIMLSAITAMAQMPGNIHWKQINTKHFKIIFPEEIEYRAQDLADFAEYVHNYDTLHINASPKQVPLILDNRTSVANAYGRLAPREMWWYLSPVPSTVLGSSEWLDLLMIHEYRHISQFDAMDHGVTKIAHYMFGQAGQAGFMFWSVPLWFFEGDAVVQETQLTESGRGRNGRFEMPVKATVMAYDNKKLDYYKYYLGSYKTYYPNQYYLGYYMVSYVNRNFGENIWGPVLRRSSYFSFCPYALSRSLKKYTGLTTPRLFDSTMTDIKQIWEENLENKQITSFETITKDKKHSWTNFYNPQFVSDDTLLYYKSGFDDVQTLYMKDLKNDKTTKIKEISGGRYTYANGKIVWAEQIPDARWDEVSYSDIVVMDLKTKKQKYLTHKERLFSPAISPDGKYIAAVEYNSDLRAKLVVLDSKTGERKAELFLPEIYLFRNPSWDPESKKIVFVQSNRVKGSGIGIWDFRDKTYSTILPFTWKENIDRPVFWKNFILFNSDYNGTDNIHAIDRFTGKRYILTSSLYGASSPEVSPDKKHLIYKNYLADGYILAEIPLNINNWIKFDSTAKRTEYFRNEKTSENIVNIVGKEKKEVQQVKDYNPAKHLLNVHSWLWSVSPDLEGGVESGYIQLLSNDYLYYMSSSFFAQYNNTGYLGSGANITFKKFYPVISLSYYQQFDFNRMLTDRYNFGTSVSLPLNLSRHNYSRSLNLQLKNTLSQYRADSVTFFDTYDYAGFSMSYGNYKNSAYRDVDTRLGQYASIIANHEFVSGSNQFTFYGKIFLPGLLRHDNITISYGFDSKTGAYPFSSQLNLPRGYSGIDYNLMRKVSATYHLPLFYPDWGWRPLFYIKRVRGKAFYDYAVVNNSTVYSSYGLQILFDFNLFGLKFDLNAGVQVAFPNNGDIQISPVVLNIPL